MLSWVTKNIAKCNVLVWVHPELYMESSSSIVAGYLFVCHDHPDFTPLGSIGHQLMPFNSEREFGTTELKFDSSTIQNRINQGCVL